MYPLMLPLISSTIPSETGASSSLNDLIGLCEPSSVTVNAVSARPFTMAPRRSTTVTGTRTSAESARKVPLSGAARFGASADHAETIAIAAIKNPLAGYRLPLGGMRYLRLLAHLAGLSAFAVALQIDDAGAATRRKRVRVKDLNVTKSESPNGPVLQNLPDPMRRNMEPSGNRSEEHTSELQ